MELFKFEFLRLKRYIYIKVFVSFLYTLLYFGFLMLNVMVFYYKKFCLLGCCIKVLFILGQI